MYLFSVLGVFLLLQAGHGLAPRDLLLWVSAGLLIPSACALLLRYGSVFERLEGFLRPLVGQSARVQEAGLVVFGQSFGISAELALALSMAKRIREVGCGLPALISWQDIEGRRLMAVS